MPFRACPHSSAAYKKKKPLGCLIEVLCKSIPGCSQERTKLGISDFLMHFPKESHTSGETLSTLVIKPSHILRDFSFVLCIVLERGRVFVFFREVGSSFVFVYGRMLGLATMPLPGSTAKLRHTRAVERTAPLRRVQCAIRCNAVHNERLDSAFFARILLRRSLLRCCAAAAIAEQCWSMMSARLLA